MEKMMNKGMAERMAKTSYKNFNVSVYCPVGNINNITDLEEFDRKFELLYKNVKVGRVYLEFYRGMHWCTREQMLKVKDYFEKKGIATSGGITTCDEEKEGFASLCYSTKQGQDILREAVKLCAEVFDELIFDDFYFINCRCKDCIAAKGNRSWAEFRMEQKRQVTEEIVMKTAKEINPNINVIVKYPQWFEVYNETGYDLVTEPQIFDSIYTGTETRNPAFAQQHLPKYLSYFIMRYLESAAPGRNLGGWFDPYECTYNLSSYLEQGYLTLFAKAKEATLFCLGSLINDPDYRLFAPAVGELFKEVDDYLGELGNPVGVAAYRPGYARGEDNIHSYLGMCGIPFEPCMEYPEDAGVLFLAEGAAYDKKIIEKMQKSLLAGADLIVTSGFLRKLGEDFKEFANISCSSRKALVKEYADTKDGGLSVSGKYSGDKEILIPQLDYCTNDVWELAAAYGTDNNFPVVLRFGYGAGRLAIITIPDNMGDFYHYPAQVLHVIRKIFMKELPVCLDAPAGVQLFLYDNHKLILRSDMPYYETVTLAFSEDVKKVKNILKQKEYSVVEGRLKIQLTPCVNYVLSW